MPSCTGAVRTCAAPGKIIMNAQKFIYATVRMLFICLLCGCGSGASSGGGDSSENSDNCSSLFPGSPVGLSCIYCMHPNAQDQAQVLGQVIRDSCNANIAISFLIDGSFGTDDDFVIDEVSSLAQGRNVTVVLYLSNGTGQRIWQSTEVHGFATDMSPEEFRSRIVNDSDLRDGYTEIVERAMGIKSEVPASVRFILVPGLEDNLTDESFLSILDLTRETAGDAVGYARSSGIGAYPGNEGGVPFLWLFT